MNIINAQSLQPFFERIQKIYADMDAAYQRTARTLGFVCTGCEDNCCRSLFFHHTYIEFLYLRSELAALHESQRLAIERRADQAGSGSNGRAAGERRMCPLNEQGRCLLYAARPMICRLHGIPHVLRRPDGNLIQGPGCAACEKSHAAPPSDRLDRTPHYQAMAALEQELRADSGLDRKIKQTVAEMILSRELRQQPFSGF